MSAALDVRRIYRLCDLQYLVDRKKHSAVAEYDRQLVPSQPQPDGQALTYTFKSLYIFVLVASS